MTPVQKSENGPASRRARFVVAYHGAAFHGFALSNNVETVAGRLNEVLSTITRVPIEVTGAGRTDAGVHARGQIISVDLPAKTDLYAIVRSVNGMCAPHLAIRDAEWTTDDFHARHDALWRHYKYTVLNAVTPDPFLVEYAWHVREPLSLPVMRLGSEALIGAHDFTSFCRAPVIADDQPVPSMKRRVMTARWQDTGNGILEFEIRANAFCHTMVRSIVGLLVEIGQGKRPASDVRSAIVAKNRAATAFVAPPEGLCLWEVGYGDPAGPDPSTPRTDGLVARSGC